MSCPNFTIILPKTPVANKLQFRHSCFSTCVVKTWIWYIHRFLWRLLWNNSYSWGSMFVECQNFAGLWRCYVVGYWFVVLQYRTIHNFIKRSSGRKFLIKFNLWKSRILTQQEQWWFHSNWVLHKLCLCYVYLLAEM